MKKLFIIFAFLAFAVGGYAQSGKAVIHVLADTGKYFTSPVEIGDWVQNTATGGVYVSKVTIGLTAHKKLSWLLASSARYTSPSVSNTSATSMTVTGATTTGTLAAGVTAVTTFSAYKAAVRDSVSVGTHNKLLRTHLAADSALVNRIVVSDTLQGVVIKSKNGAKWRLKISNAGVFSVVAVP